MYSRPGEIIANSNGTINFFVNNMEISSADNKNGHKMLFTIEPFSSNGIININANNNLKIRGNIGVGFWEKLYLVAIHAQKMVR